jgi:hypothetical protein
MADDLGKRNHRLGRRLTTKVVLRVLSAVDHRWLLGLLVGGRFDRRFLKVNRRCLGNVATEAFAKDSGVIGINPRVLRRAGDRDIRESGIDEFGVNGGIHVD